MPPSEPDPPEPDDPEAALRRIERRVQRVRDLDAFHFSRREDGRFRCELKKPIEELPPDELEGALTALETLSAALRSRLEEIRGEVE